jgi:RNA polymerase sigma-70 factor (ECF subfamily)
VNADDCRLIADCLDGRPAAFGELVRRYQDRLYNTVYRLVGNADDAQDITQEAFLNAYQGLGTFRGNARFFTWLYRIAINTAVSQRRKHRVAIPLHVGQKNHDGSMGPADPSTFDDPGHGLDQADQERVIQDALNRLSAEHRTVIVLKDIEEQSYEAIASILNVPIGTVRSRLHRARLELRRLLEEKGLHG